MIRLFKRVKVWHLGTFWALMKGTALTNTSYAKQVRALWVFQHRSKLAIAGRESALALTLAALWRCVLLRWLGSTTLSKELVSLLQESLGSAKELPF